MALKLDNSIPKDSYTKQLCMARSDLRLEAQIRKLWEICFFATPQISFFWGEIRVNFSRP